jgi:inorganic pyrophosphatase
MVHAWHDVSPGKDLPRDFQAVIEIPLGSNVKYELDKDTGLLKVDRIIHSAVFRIMALFRKPMRRTTTRWTCWCFVRNRCYRWR